MVIALKIKKEKASEIINKLKKEKLLNTIYKIERSDDYVFVPILEEIEEYKENIVVLENPQKQKQKQKKLKEVLKSKLDKKTIEKVNSAYDIVGDIIVIGLDNSLKEHYDVIGQALLKIHPNVKTILNKIGDHEGIYRTQEMEFVYGEDKRETIIVENKCRIKIDVEKVFCSTRLSEERKRITSLVKDNEIVAVYFAGAGPFALAISKNTEAKEIVAIELNDLAVKYLKENIILNKVSNIKAILGDVTKEALNYKDYFDRVVMPLPKTSDLFLDSAIFSVKDKGVIHIYRFVPKDDPYSEMNKLIEESCEKNNVSFNYLNKKIIRSYSPSIVQVVVDIEIKK